MATPAVSPAQVVSPGVVAAPQSSTAGKLADQPGTSTTETKASTSKSKPEPAKASSKEHPVPASAESHDARQTTEPRSRDRSAGKSGQAVEPSTAAPSQSPIAVKPADQPDTSTPETKGRSKRSQPEAAKPASGEQPVPASADSRDARQRAGSKAGDRSDGKPAQAVQPTVVKLPRSPIVGKAPDQLARDQAPPEKHKIPEPDLKVEPKPRASAPEPNVRREEPRREPTPAAQERPASAQPAAPQPAAPQPAAERPGKEKKGGSEEGGTNTVNRGHGK